MRYRLLLPLAAAGALVACDSKDPDPAQSPPADGAEATPATVPAPDAEARAALENQTVGKALLGHTVRLAGDAFVPTDPPFAPEAYFVYYSASW